MLVKFILLSLVVLIASTAVKKTDLEEFRKFVIFFNKTYNSTEEENLRFKIWKKNLEFINKHNAEADAGEHTFWLKMNQFGDLTDEEWRKIGQSFGVRQPTGINSQGQIQVSIHRKNNGDDIPLYKRRVKSLPNHVDWRPLGYVTRVKNQGLTCGSCWAFSAVGTMEGAHFKATGRLVELSEQQLVDCSKNGDNEGCNGGYPDEAIKYVIFTGGIDSERAYPYRAVDQRCLFNPLFIAARMKSLVRIPRRNELALQDAIATIGPISVSIIAINPTFKFYSHGVYFEPKCNPLAGPNDLDHAVTAVGYGSVNELEFYIIKNSWGTFWGENGYIRMSRNRGNNCAIATDAVYAIAERKP